MAPPSKKFRYLVTKCKVRVLETEIGMGNLPIAISTPSTHFAMIEHLFQGR